jgi:hypothetical protein
MQAVTRVRYTALIGYVAVTISVERSLGILNGGFGGSFQQ